MTREEIEAERVGFESAIAPHFNIEDRFKIVKSETKYNGRYFYGSVDLAWTAWLAAKQDAKNQFNIAK